ncbi:hypothetical protein RF55_6914 [Lasius niger]|uniref:CCHC-type domain-containing protein n=1 Tax=Lasius niger TaxID=67767 RepID=A0A0J7KS01_LASNI|nr:hypothetical protein RF55_6914 [Lasius niger]
MPAGIVPGNTAEMRASTLNSFTIEFFDPEITTLQRWLQRLEGAFAICGINGTAKTAYLIHYMGAAAFDTVCDRLSEEDPFQATFEAIKAILYDIYQPEPLEIAENFKFHQRKQEEGESIQQFVTALHKLSVHCRFGAYLKTALRNQFVFGLASAKIQSRLLERKDLTFDLAVQVATSMELSDRGAKQLQGTSTAVEYVQAAKKVQKKKTSTDKYKNKSSKTAVNDVTNRKTSYNNGNDSKDVKCYRCGKAHLASKCTLNKEIRCNGCGRKGHLQRVCFQAKDQTNQVEEVLHVEQAEFRDKFEATLSINGKEVTFEVNSGSAVTLMSKRHARALFPGSTIHCTNLKLITFCKSEVKAIGYITVRVEDREKTRELNIYLTNVDRKPLLGREWLRQIRNICTFHSIQTAQIDYVNSSWNTSIEKILLKYKNIRDADFSEIQGVEARITLKSDAQPVFVRARAVPFKLLPLVEKELDNLETLGIIEKVNSSVWATPIVPVLKKDGRVRICGDYKSTVNPQVIIDKHPLPTIDELFTAISGGVIFSKIDLRQAYLQMRVRSEDRDVLTLSTHRGLYRVNRMMYGIASAPAIWQREIEIILQGIPKTAVFLDDIVVTGETEEQHLKNLDTVLNQLQKYNIRINLEKSQFALKEIKYCG